MIHVTCHVENPNISYGDALELELQWVEFLRREFSNGTGGRTSEALHFGYDTCHVENPNASSGDALESELQGVNFLRRKFV